jgi:hypothetical protein
MAKNAEPEIAVQDGSEEQALPEDADKLSDFPVE